MTRNTTRSLISSIMSLFATAIAILLAVSGAAIAGALPT
jgi:hypothetical protein